MNNDDLPMHIYKRLTQHGEQGNMTGLFTDVCIHKKKKKSPPFRADFYYLEHIQ